MFLFKALLLMIMKALVAADENTLHDAKEQARTSKSDKAVKQAKDVVLGELDRDMSSPRRYSFADIELIRGAVTALVIAENKETQFYGSSKMLAIEEFWSQIEMRMRTYMNAGISATDVVNGIEEIVPGWQEANSQEDFRNAYLARKIRNVYDARESKIDKKHGGTHLRNDEEVEAFLTSF